MSKTRLTNAFRERIAKNALIKSGVIAELEAIMVKRQEIARDARVFALGGKEKTEKLERLYEKFERIEKELTDSGVSIYNPDGKSQSICLSIGGRRLGWCSYGDDSKGQNIQLLTPNSDRCMFAADHEISTRFDEVFAAEAKLEARKKDIEVTVWAALNSVTTIKRLIEVWPESKELIPDGIDTAKQTLPALKVEDLNRLIGLPTEQAA
ncbi:Nmad5 family putative nucleotide modification protein [Lelliottia amnigena]|uniref:Nmad5 family putative nucleotide modification protein n=1 Tax=Lelliottia amnigena TaxID=61646 RepID=UPI004055FAD3